MGPEDDPAVSPLRRPGAPLAGPARSLLAPWLLAAAADLAPGLGLVRSLAGVGLLPHHRLVEGGGIGRHPEDLRREPDLAGLLPALVHDLHRGGLFDGCRAHALLLRVLASRIRTTLSGWPGTSPLTRSRLRSRSTRTTCRLRVVRWELPRWPAIRIPL